MLIPAFASLIFVSGAGPTDFEIRTTADAPQAAEIQAVGADGAINLASGKTVPAGQWYSLRRSPGILPAWPRGPHVELGIGDKVAGTVASADGDAIRLQVSFPGRPAQPLRFPLSAVRVAWLTSRPESDDPDWLAGPRKRDVIRSRDGDVARGALTGIDAAHNMLRYNADGKDHALDLSKVAAVAFNTDLARVRRPKGPYYRLTLADGTRLSATTVTFDGNSWSV
ncbi:MAG: hypothetical protein J2P46_01215, partial [Zavarzinella sp.]|nr:hypothetical protein [Zavarzinella sp.]